MCMVNAARSQDQNQAPENPAKVPLGSGLANNARLAIRGRQDQIDALVNGAVRGNQRKK